MKKNKTHKNKIVIQDYVLQMDGGTEQELPEKSHIRFEFNGYNIVVEMVDEGLSVRKTAINHNITSDQMSVLPKYANQLIIN